MNSRFSLVVHTGFIAIAAAVLLLGLACGGGDDDTATEPDATEARDDAGEGSGDGGAGANESSGDLADYFAEVDAVFEEADSLSDELEAAFDEAYANAQTVEEAREALGAFLLDTHDIYSDALDTLEGIEPPEEAADEHEAFIRAGSDLLDVSERLFQALQDVETEADLNQLSEDFDAEGTAAANAADEACFDLQGVADDAGIDVDLNCED